jgi:gliding motility-associated-like protein
VRYLPPVDLGPDTLMCNDEVLVLRPVHPLSDFQWSDSSTDSVRNITAAGTYLVKVLSDECLIEDTIEVEFVDCPGFSPNILTANGDGLNENLVFENIDNRTWSIEIFNRWGQRVFFSEHYRNDWDGKNLSDGIYYYKLSSTELNKVVKGWVRTVR